jgi:murein L,D-transpeptidase YcbB/YkuD
VKNVRLSRLLASTAVAMVLMGSGWAVHAQQMDEQQLNAAVPMPDTNLPPPPTLKDIAPPEAKTAEPAKPAADAQPAPAPAEPVVATPATKPAGSEAAPVEKAAAPAATPAQEAKAPAEPAKPVAVSNQAVADALRELIASKQFDRLVSRKAERSAAEAYYKHHDFAPIWIADGAADARAKAAVDTLQRAEEVGLDSTDYPVPTFKSDMSAQALAEAELRLTSSALTYARQAQVGRISFTRVDKDISFKQEAPDPEKVLEKLASADNAGAALDGYNPPQPEFKALRKALAELRHGGPVKNLEEKPVARVHVPEGKILRPGVKDARVIAVRKRLDIAGDKENPLYDDAVFEAVKAFQVSADLGSDGMLGPNTVRALNGEQHAAHHGPRNAIDTIVVNMERWRWFPRDLGDVHVIVNVPDYTLTLYNHGEVYWHTKIVAGKPGKETPMISAEMKYITVNPTWNVPPSIIQNEYLPALEQDPNALDRIGLKLEQNPDGTVRIYQPPGAANALGRIRFNFPNKFLVYQHDTPDKYLFAKEKRAYSHGCMRVQNPETYAVKLLSLADPAERYSEARIQHMYGSNEININFKKNIWVHLTYQTAFVDAAGKLQFRDDVYGRDGRMIAILKGSERRVAEIPIERAPDTSSKPVRMPVGMYSGGPRYDDAAPRFFDWLFGGGGSDTPVYRPRGYIAPRAYRDSYRYR